MLTIDYRPRSFDEVAGQDRVKKILKAITKNPDVAPRSIMLYGGFGCGKTTLARIFAAELNKVKYDRENDISQSMFYMEFDTSVIGNVDVIKELRDTFVHTGEGYKVFCMDEIHLASKQAQSALLKVIEEVKDNCFFVFCTTDPDKVLNTIRSRSLELELTTISDEDLKERLKQVCVEENREVTDNVLDIIVKRSNGHGRNAMMLLDNYFLIGEEFLQSVNTSRDLYLQLLANCFKGDKIALGECIFKLLHYSLTDLKLDYEELLLEIIKVALKVQEPKDKAIQIISGAIAPNLMKIIGMLKSDVIMGSFDSDRNFQSAMYLIYAMLGRKEQETAKAPQVQG